MHIVSWNLFDGQIATESHNRAMGSHEVEYQVTANERPARCSRLLADLLVGLG